MKRLPPNFQQADGAFRAGRDALAAFVALVRSHRVSRHAAVGAVAEPTHQAQSCEVAGVYAAHLEDVVGAHLHAGSLGLAEAVINYRSRGHGR